MTSALSFLTFLQDGPVPMAVINGSRVITLVSQAFERATGLTAGDAAPEWIEGGSTELRPVTLGNRQYGVWVHRLPDGLMVVLHDRTEARDTEEKLWAQQVHLNRIYAELTVRDRVLDRTLARVRSGMPMSPSLERRVEEGEREREAAARLCRQLSRETAEALAAKGQHDLARHKANVTVLFADMPEIDEVLADMEPEDFIEFLSEYRAAMSRILFEHGGTIERFHGVALKAFFGDPISQDDHAVRAVRAALRMRSHLQTMRPRWFPTATDLDLQMGVHTGYAMVGMVGPEDACDYTAVGRNVTLAHAIQREARPGQLLLSGRTYDAVRDTFYTEAHQVALRGSNRPMEVYKVLGERTPLEEPSAAAVAMPAAPGQTRMGPYLVLEKIGEGGMAVVYKGLDEGLNRHVALKVLARQAEDKKFVTRFQREARGLAKVNSPYVAQIYYIGAEAKPPFFAMEFVEGRTLREIIQREGPIPARRALDSLLQAAQGLLAAAECGIIHRDVKPDNVMITSKGQVKVMDFGLVKRADDESGVTAHGIIIGTPRYMSPEQARCEEVDHRSDIYSLGATFFHMITGFAPFDGDNALAIMRKHEIAPLPALSTLPKNVTPGAYDIIKRMMAKGKEERFQDYRSLIQAIEAC